MYSCIYILKHVTNVYYDVTQQQHANGRQRGEQMRHSTAAEEDKYQVGGTPTTEN